MTVKANNNKNKEDNIREIQTKILFNSSTKWTHDLIKKKTYYKHYVHGILTWMYEFSPGNTTKYVVFDEESEFSGPRTPNLRPDQVL